MLLDYWKLREQPFGVTPDPRFLYFSPGHREALASLFYAIEAGRGFSSLIAEPGLGKTTLLFQLLRRWRGYVHSAFLFQTQCDSRELIRYLLQDLGLRSDDTDLVRMHNELQEFLVSEAKAGRRVVIFIDEAQNLSDGVLETVRLLTNFEALDKKLLQIVLAGQPELAQRLSSPGLTQLGQRIAIRAHLEPLPSAEVARYIAHRLQVAGDSGRQLFTPGALGLVAALSNGIPRLINALCFNALSVGCAMRRQQIDSDVVREAAADFSFNRGTVSPATHRTQANEQLPPSRSRSSRQPFGSWFKKSVGRKRALQTGVLALLVGLGAAYVGAHTRGLSAYLSPSSDANRSRTSPVAIHTSLAKMQPAVPTKPSDLYEPVRTSIADASLDSFAYVVQPHDTIRDLCLSTLGHYDAEVLREIRALNPDLKDLDHLEAGQEIRLPHSPASEQLEPTH